MVKFKVVRLCRQEAMSVVPTEKVRYDLERAVPLLSQAGYQVNDQGLMLIAVGGGREITLYASGRIMIAGVASKEEAGRVAEETYATVEPSREDAARTS